MTGSLPRPTPPPPPLPGRLSSGRASRDENPPLVPATPKVSEDAPAASSIRQREMDVASLSHSPSSTKARLQEAANVSAINCNVKNKDRKPPSPLDAGNLSSARLTSFTSQTSKDANTDKQRGSAGEQHLHEQVQQQVQTAFMSSANGLSNKNPVSKVNNSIRGMNFHKHPTADHENSNHNGKASKKKATSQQQHQRQQHSVMEDPFSSTLVANSLNKDEACDIKKFRSMSLSQLDSDSINGNVNNSYINSNKLASHELQSSCMSITSNFTPRPVRVTVLKDVDQSSNNNGESTPMGRSKKVFTTTTSTFIKNICQLPLDSNSNDDLMDTSVGNAVNSLPITSSSASQTPSSAKTLDSLPDYVDRKGRCLRHRNVKMFKKKLLGGYEMIKEMCPNCEEEAPYEELWSGRARTRRSSQGGSPYSNRWVSLERSGLFDKSINSVWSKQHMFRSKEQKSRGRVRKPKSNERGRVNSEPDESDVSLPYAPSSNKGEQDEVVLKGGFSGEGWCPIVPIGEKQAYPPSGQGQGSMHPQQFRNEHHQGNHVSPLPPPSCRNESFHLKSTKNKIRSLSAGRRPACRVSSCLFENGRGPSISDISNETKAILDKSSEKLSSLRNKARSSSQKLASSASSHEQSRPSPLQYWAPKSSSRNKQLLTSESFSSFQNEWACEEGILSISENAVLPSSQSIKKVVTPAKSKFDKKTGRCKKHPSIILAKKSSFSKGWDIIRDRCPFCSEEFNKGNNDGLGGDEGKLSEISKKKMNALLQGRPNTVNGANHQQTLFDALLANDEESLTFLRHKASPNCNLTNEAQAEERAFRCHSPPSGKNNQVGNNDVTFQRVSRMPYTTPWGESGWYTGEVNNFGKPHGQGRMRCRRGNKTEGEWTNGYSVEFLENQGRMKSGFGTNVAPWKDKDQDQDLIRLSSKASSGVRRGGKLSSAQYQAASQYPVAPPQPVYHSSTYGLAPYNSHQASVIQWNQSTGYQHSPGYQAYQPPGGPMGHHFSAYHQGYHQT